MSSRWRSATIQEFVDRGQVELKTGPFGTQLHASDYVEHGTPVVNVRNLGFGVIVAGKLEFVSDSTVERLASHLLQADDIVFGRKGAVERHAFINAAQSKWLQGSDCLRLRIFGSELFPRFVSYALLTEKHKRWMANQCSHGATMASLNQAIICRIPLRLPSPEMQRRIASILSAYDDLIENNTRRIKILEEMAQMLYREWFVHFRFPGHEKVRMVESELGPIPEGWTATQLEKILTLEYGKALKAGDRLGGLIPVYGSSGVVGRHSQKLSDGPGLIVGRKGNVGSVFLCHSDFWVIDTAYYVCSEISRNFLYFNLRAQNFLNNDAAVPGLNRNQAHSLPIVLPDRRIINSFDGIVQPMFDLKRCLELHNANLRATRDLLLPKLISGEIPVEAADDTAAQLMEEIAQPA